MQVKSLHELPRSYLISEDHDSHGNIPSLIIGLLRKKVTSYGVDGLKHPKHLFGLCMIQNLVIGKLNMAHLLV